MKLTSAFNALTLTASLTSFSRATSSDKTNYDAAFIMKVRELMNDPAIAAAAAQYGGSSTSTLKNSIAGANQKYDSKNTSGRDLQDKSYDVIDHDKLRCFYKCVEDNMTTDECIAYIEETIGTDLTGHEIKELQLKVNSPRPISWVEATFWMVGIPTNIYGEVDCAINGGYIVYPWEWIVYDGTGGTNTYALPPVDCRGKTANDCCNEMMAVYEADGIPLEDGQGNCLSCWVHQEPLEPVLADGEAAGGAVSYLEQQWDGTTCNENPLSETAVVSADDDVKTQIPIVRTAIQNVIDLGEGATVTCDDMTALFEDLLFYGRAFPRAMSQIPSLLCGECDDSTDITLTEELILSLIFIKKELIVENLNSVENCIIIYEDRHGFVVEPPKIGGSREGLDVDLDDPDCVENEPPAPISCPPTQIINKSNDGCICPDPYVDGAPGEALCVCPEGTTMAQNGDCEPSAIQCPPDQVPNRSNDGCICEKPSQILEGGACICPEGTTMAQSGECEPSAIQCPPGQTANANNDGCICENPSHVLEGGECICPAGQVMLQDGGCGPAGGPGVCPPGLTYNAAKKACWSDCGCGYCAPIKASKGGDGLEETSCCTMNGGGNNCNPPNNIENEECGRQSFIFTFNDGDNGNVCSGVEISATSAQRGCGCQPNRTYACEFDSLVESDVCLHCSFINLDNKDSECDACAACLADQCQSTQCIPGSFEQCIQDDVNASTIARRGLLSTSNTNTMRGLAKPEPVSAPATLKSKGNNKPAPGPTPVATAKTSQCVDTCRAYCEKGADYSK